MSLENPTELNVESSVTIIWGVERGKRLALWRKAMLMTQSQLGAKLGVKQQVIHAIESGRMEVCPSVTLRAFRATLKGGFDFVLFGSNAEAYAEKDIHDAYWKFQFEKTRHKKRVAKRTNAERIEIDGWLKKDDGLRHAYARGKPESKRGNRSTGPRPKNKGGS